MNMYTPNFVDENIAKLAELFTNCGTETIGEVKTDRNGTPPSTFNYNIYWDLLKQEVSDHVVEGAKGRYRLD